MGHNSLVFPVYSIFIYWRPSGNGPFLEHFFPWKLVRLCVYRGLSENLSSLGKSVEDTLEQYNDTEGTEAEDVYANCAEEEVT